MDINSLISELKIDFSNERIADGQEKFRSVIEYARKNFKGKPEGYPARALEAKKFKNKFESLHNAHVSKKTRNIILHTDSLALPRGVTGVSIANCYPALVAKLLRRNRPGAYSFDVRSLRGNTTEKVRLALEHDKNPRIYEGGICIVHSGIVDCAPRVFMENDLEYVKALAGQSGHDGLVEIAKNFRHYIQGSPDEAVYVTAAEYRQNIQEICRILFKRNCAPYFVTTVIPSRQGATKMNGAILSNSIEKYNSILSDLSRDLGFHIWDADDWIWSSLDPFSCFTNDNYHFNNRGHREVFKGIVRHCQEHPL